MRAARLRRTHGAAPAFAPALGAAVAVRALVEHSARESSGDWLDFLLQSRPPEVIAGLQTAAILAGERIWRAVPVAAGAMAVMVGLDLALVPRFGAPGAASATVAGTIVMVVVFGRFLRDTSGLRTSFPSLRILGAGVVTAAVAALLAPTGLVAAGASAALVFVVLVLVTGAVRRADVTRLRALVRGAGAVP